MTWDENEGRAISSTEKNLKAIMDEFDEMDYVETPTAPSKTNQTIIDQHMPPVNQVDAATQDGISSFGNSLLGGNRQAQVRASAFATNFNPPDDGSVAQRSMADTVTSLESRMTALEGKLEALDRITAFLDRFEKNKASGSTVASTSTNQNEANTTSVEGASAEKSSSEAPHA